MSSTPKIVAFAGSAREKSFNKMLVAIAAEGAREAGADVTLIDLKDYPMPIYDGDLEDNEGIPENAQKLKKLFKSHDGFLIATPEYNSAITPLLKNMIDWVSRPQEGEEILECYKNKVAALVATSPGSMGGMRVLPTVRALLSNIQVLVIPAQLAVPDAFDVFNEDGTMKDSKKESAAKNVGRQLAETIARLKCGA